MPYKDPEQRKIKQAEYSKAHYERNRKAIIAKINQNKKANRRWFATYKKTLSCIECGQNHPATLDFHHVIHDKDHRKVNDLVSDGHSRVRILKEIAKCVVLCSNCHRIVHHEEREIRKKNVALAKKAGNIHTNTHTKGSKMATKRPMAALFAGKETKKEEKAEKKMTGKAYAKAEKVEEKGMKAAKKPVKKGKY